LRRLILHIKAKMKLFLGLLFIVLVQTVSVSLDAQYISSDIKMLLSRSDRDEIKRAEKLKEYGDGLMQEAKEIEKQNGLDFNTQSDYAPKKINQLDDKKLKALKAATRKKIRANNQYGSAYIIMIAILNKNIDKNIDALTDDELEFVLDLAETGTELLKEGQKTRRKSMTKPDELSAYPYLIEAVNIEAKALSKLKDAYALILKPTVVQSAKQNQEIEIKSIAKQERLYYRIQIAASQTALSVNRLKQIYPDLTLISSEYENGWYKYSIRKNFKTYVEASEFKNSINVPGAFIISFLNGKKVPVTEAIATEKN